MQIKTNYIFTCILESRTKVVATLELYRVSPILPNQCRKMTRAIHFGTIHDSFSLLVAFPKPRSQVRVLIYQKWPISVLVLFSSVFFLETNTSINITTTPKVKFICFKNAQIKFHTFLNLPLLHHFLIANQTVLC